MRNNEGTSVLERILVRAALLAPLLFVAACATSEVATNSADSAGPRIQRGRASWYGPGFQGRRTASGETFQAGAMTAAHRTLPFGTRLRVVNESTGRSVVVRINDRGPFYGGRIIDLAQAPAQQLGLTGSGATTVALHRVD